MSGDEFVTPSVITGRIRRHPRGHRARRRLGDLLQLPRRSPARDLTKAFVLDDFPYTDTLKDGTQVRRVRPRAEAPVVLHDDDRVRAGACPCTSRIPKPPKMKNILGEYSAELGLKQFRCAETEKFPHVTFFFNDYREEPFPGEDRQIVPRRSSAGRLAAEHVRPDAGDERVRRVRRGGEADRLQRSTT